jgi:hypothetical protein
MDNNKTNNLKWVATLTEFMISMSDLSLNREILATLEPDYVQEANSDKRQAALKYHQAVLASLKGKSTYDYINNHYYVGDMLQIIERMGNYWDNWDGKPTPYVTDADIERVRREYGLSKSDLDEYFSLENWQKVRGRMKLERAWFLNL